MKNIKRKEKNFKELKERILNNVMKFNDLENLLKDNGYYGMFSHSLMQEAGDKYLIICKAKDDYHYDLEFLFVIDANTNVRILNGEIKEKVLLVEGDNTFKRILSSEFTEGESPKVVVTDFQKVLDFNEKIIEVLINERY